MSTEIEKLENGEKSTWGGKRPNSGRKPLMDKEQLEEVKALIAQHGAEEDNISVSSSDNAIEKGIRVIGLLNKLYALGIAGNVPAAKEYLDRVMGKSKESIDHTSGGERINGVVILPSKNENTLATPAETSNSSS